MNSQEHTWETVARFFSPNEALFFKNILEGHGIPAFVPNEYMGHLDVRLVQVQGGVHLKVPSDRLEEAKDLLEAPPDFDETLEEEYEDDAGDDIG